MNPRTSMCTTRTQPNAFCLIFLRFAAKMNESNNKKTDFATFFKFILIPYLLLLFISIHLHFVLNPSKVAKLITLLLHVLPAKNKLNKRNKNHNGMEFLKVFSIFARVRRANAKTKRNQF